MDGGGGGCGVGGLPHYVLTFLCHMESYKDLLKWNITEGSHKLTLTLTWNFRRNRSSPRRSLWEKLQRAMHLGRFSETSSVSRFQSIPSNLTRFLEDSTDERRESGSPLDGKWVPFRWTNSKQRNHHHHHPHLQQHQRHHHHHPHQQQPEHERSSFSLTSMPPPSAEIRSSNSHHRGGSGTGGGGSSQLLRTRCGGGRPRIRSFSSYHNLPARLAHGGADRSPLHFSWTGASLEAASSTEAVDDLRSCSQAATSPCRTEKLSPSSTLRRGSVTSRGGVLCRRESERTEEDDDDDDDDDLTERSSDGATTTSASVSTSLPSAGGGRGRYEALMSALDQQAAVQGGGDGLWPPWSSLLFHGSFLRLGGGGGEGPTSGTEVLVAAGGDSDDADAGGSDTTDADSADDEQLLQQQEKLAHQQTQTVNQTVMRCLDSCDKILFRHSTTIT